MSLMPYLMAALEPRFAPIICPIAIIKPIPQSIFPPSAKKIKEARLVEKL